MDLYVYVLYLFIDIIIYNFRSLIKVTLLKVLIEFSRIHFASLDRSCFSYAI